MTPSLATDVTQGSPAASSPSSPSAKPARNLALVRCAWWAVALGAFHAAHLSPVLSPLAVLFVYGLLELTAVATVRRAFYAGLTLGLACYAPHLQFFLGIFGLVAAVLWVVVAFWVGLFVAVQWQARARFGVRRAAWLAPVMWIGLEYFRSELYYLRFSWLTIGLAFPWESGGWGATRLGVHGVGLVVAAMAALAWSLRSRWRWALIALGMASLTVVNQLPRGSVAGTDPSGLRRLEVAGMQMEFPGPVELITGLDELARKYPAAGLLILSEYTLDGPVPDSLKVWCRKRQRHLLVGGKDLKPGGQFYNTAFVVDPQGAIVFKQVKSVPIQFFNDGLPAPTRAVWNSPWGRIGIPTCYDLSYQRVVDDFVKAGAEALLVPTMDPVDWGRYQHELHGRIGPLRAAEYGIPVVRLASSGISQIIDRSGAVREVAPFAGDRAMLGGQLTLAGSGQRPWDRTLGPVGVAVTALVLVWLGLSSWLARRAPSGNPQ